MNDDWQRVKSIFNSAVELDTAGRREYLDEACEGDAELRQQVEKLLDSYESGFMEVEGDDRDTLKAGQTIGRYEIERLLGSGGMGEVYLALDRSLDRRVAIKVLNEKYRADEANLSRFVQEAKAASALNHPNILVIHGIGETDRSHYIVSEFVEGNTLRRTLIAGELSLSEIIDISIQTAEALSAAHKAGIVHRDIKPENLIIRNDGYVKVVDFGLAKLTPNQPSFVGLEVETMRQDNTAEGLIMGTINYMSPEQAKGEKVDARSDIFSLGVVMYEMISGQMPFAAESAPETLANLIKQEPVRLSDRSDVPEKIERIVTKMLRKKPDDRYQTMKGLLADLRESNGKSNLVRRPKGTSTPESENKTAILSTTTGDIERTTQETANELRPWYRRLATTIAAAAMVIIVIVATVLWYVWSAYPAKPPITSIAVLPLTNLSGDDSQEYFVDGMTDALISNLSRIKNLRVISRTSVMRYKGTHDSLPDIAKDLGVDAVVEGSVVKSGDRVRVSAQLIHAASDSPIWSRTYDRNLSDVLKLQSDVAQTVVREIQVQLTVAEQTKLASARSIDPKAHESYLLGKYHLTRNTDQDRERSISYFQRAVEIEPEYSDAYAGLAAAWLDRGIWGQNPSERFGDFETRVREAATNAIRIDPDNANAHVAMCQLLHNYEYKWAEAEDAAKRAIEIDPNNIEALTTYSWLLQSLGRHGEVRVLMEKAEKLDPVSSKLQSSFGRMLYRARNYAEAEAHLQRAIELDPSDYGTYERLGYVYFEMGRLYEARNQFKMSASIKGVEDSVPLAVIYARTGKRKKALETLSRIPRPSPWELTRVYTALGDRDKAFAVLTAAVEARNSLLVHLREEPGFVPLHDDARWPPLMKRLNFPEN